MLSFFQLVRCQPAFVQKEQPHSLTENCTHSHSSYDQRFKRSIHSMIIMVSHSSVLIIILVFAVFFSFVYASEVLYTYGHQANIVLTKPKISQLQALQIASQDLKTKVPNMQEFGLWFSFYNVSASNNQEYLRHSLNGSYWPFSYIHANPEPLQLHLYFVSANGTIYIINSTNGEIIRSCNPDTTQTCSFTGYDKSPAFPRDRLLYSFEIAALSSTNYPSNIYLVDAETGQIIWNQLDVDKYLPHLNYDGNRAGSATIVPPPLASQSTTANKS